MKNLSGEKRSSSGAPAPLVIVVSRQEVAALDTTAPLRLLKGLAGSPTTAKRFSEAVDIQFDGYDHMRLEPFEISEIRSYVCHLDQDFPYWLYFMSKEHRGLQSLLRCLLPYSIAEETRSKLFPELIDLLLTRRWLPAMNDMCRFVGSTEEQIKRLTERTLTYLICRAPDGQAPVMPAPAGPPRSS